MTVNLLLDFAFPLLFRNAASRLLGIDVYISPGFVNRRRDSLMEYVRDFAGEFIGTCILVFFGCGSVAVTILFSAHVGLFQIAMVWGVGVALAIYATRHLSCAHLNPAVSIAMVVGKRMRLSKLPTYLTAQFCGAFFAAVVLYLLFSSSIARYESLHAIVRGTPASVRTAMMFGEFYSQPGLRACSRGFGVGCSFD